MKFLRRALFISLAAAGASSMADEAPSALYSFADVYRLTVNTAPEALTFAPAAPVSQIRVTLAAQDVFAAAEPRFTVEQVPAAQGWMLLLAGLAAAGWVAHRRLTSAY